MFNFLNADAAVETVSKASMHTDELISWGLKALTTAGTKILLALVLYIVGSWVIKRLTKITSNVFKRRNLDASLAGFFVSMIKISLTAILIFSVIGILGVDTSSFLAIFASAGLAVGMALSGTLQNFAGGVLILFLRPFKVGDVIESKGYTGSVKEISLFSTLLNTPDNKMIIIPNGELANGSITNYSKEETRCVVWTFGVAYGTEFAHVKPIIEDVLSKHNAVLSDKATTVVISELADSSVNITVKAWCNSADYWTVLFDINEQMYARFNAENVSFPFPQLDVNLKK